MVEHHVSCAILPYKRSQDSSSTISAQQRLNKCGLRWDCSTSVYQISIIYFIVNISNISKKMFSSARFKWFLSTGSIAWFLHAHTSSISNIEKSSCWSCLATWTWPLLWIFCTHWSQAFDSTWTRPSKLTLRTSLRLCHHQPLEITWDHLRSLWVFSLEYLLKDLKSVCEETVIVLEAFSKKWTDNLPPVDFSWVFSRCKYPLVSHESMRQSSTSQLCTCHHNSPACKDPSHRRVSDDNTRVSNVSMCSKVQ